MYFFCFAECHNAECHHAECHYGVIMLCHYAKCHYAECHHAECHHAECHHAECHYAECHAGLYIGDTTSTFGRSKLGYIATSRQELCSLLKFMSCASLADESP
jgi:hypothetical protein